jgi:5-enolpyruvylshikimate-3-phosphate synthase
MQSQEEPFTLKGERTKKTFESKTPISSQNFSGFAPLRETSVTQSGRAEEES